MKRIEKPKPKPRSLKDHVLEDVRESQQKKRNQQLQKNKVAFDCIEKREVIYHSNRMEYFVYLPKDELRKMSSAALAVYPVLCCNADFSDDKKWVQMSQENIAEYAGININTAMKGLSDLMKLGMLKRRIKTVRMVHMYEYNPVFIRGNDIEANRDNLLQFRHSIVDMGIWSNLTNAEKRLYIAMRIEARFEAEAYGDIEEIDLEFDHEAKSEFYNGSGYANRKWDAIATETWSDLVWMISNTTGLDEETIAKGLKQLDHYGLIETVSPTQYKVFIIPEVPDYDK